MEFLEQKKFTLLCRYCKQSKSKMIGEVLEDPEHLLQKGMIFFFWGGGGRKVESEKKTWRGQAVHHNSKRTKTLETLIKMHRNALQTLKPA